MAVNKIKIKKLGIKKFMSLVDTGVEFPDNGVIQVTGRVGNDMFASNGAGKSALLESIFWVLYGKTFRGSTGKDWHVNLEGSVGDKPFVIARHPKGIDYTFDGVISEAKLKTDVQAQILRDILDGISWKTFSTLTYFTPFTITKWFVQMTDTDRKAILLEVLDLSWLDRLYEIVKDEYYKLTSKKSVLEGNRARKFGQLEGLTHSNENMIRNEILLMDEHLKILQNLHPIIPQIPSLALNNQAQLGEALKVINDLISEYTNLQVTLNSTAMTLKDRKAKLTLEKSRLFDELDLFKRHNSCPTCHRPITEEFRQQKIEEINELMSEKEKELTQVLAQVRQTEDDLQIVGKTLGHLIAIQTGLQRIISFVSDSNRTEMIEKLKNEVAQIESELEDIKAKEGELVLWMDVFSNTGVKSVVIEGIFKQIVEATAEFADFVGIPQFKQSMTKGRIKYDNYKDLSSGEKRRAEIALLFALRSVIPINTAFLVIDEIFDHLDVKGIQSVVPLLDIVGEREQVFVVSHRPDIGIPSIAKDVLVVKDPKTGVSKVFSDEA